MRKRGMIRAGLLAVTGAISLAPAIAASPPPAPASGPGQLKPYRINPGDEIEIYVWGDERLQRVLKVLPDGSVSFPLVGRIDALNKLPTDLEGVVVTGLADQYRNTVPRVTVSVIGLAARHGSFGMPSIRSQSGSRFGAERGSICGSMDQADASIVPISVATGSNSAESYWFGSRL